jgi:hypothetical protein
MSTVGITDSAPELIASSAVMDLSTVKTLRARQQDRGPSAPSHIDGARSNLRRRRIAAAIAAMRSMRQ